MPTFVGGIGSGWSLAEESTYGTAVVPTRAHPLISETLSLTRNRSDSSTLKAGNLLVPKTSWRPSTQVGGGGVQTLMYTDGSAMLTKAMLGGIGTTGAGPYVHTAQLTQALPSYSIQVAFGATTTAMVKKIEGAVCTSWELAAAVDQNLTLGMDWVYEDEVLVEQGGTGDDLSGSFASGQQAYNATNIEITVDGAEYCISSMTLSGDNTLKSDGYCLGTTLIRKPVRNGFAAITGQIEMPLDVTSRALYDIWATAEVVPLVMTATLGADTFVINALIRLDGTTPTVSGVEEQMVSIPFVVSPDDGDTDLEAFNIVTTNGDSTA